MRVLKNLTRAIEDENSKRLYCYRVVSGNKLGVQAYGIEVERIDTEGNEVINVERDCVECISPHPHKVYELLNILYNNAVSPIHLIDIIGEYVDECVSDFDESYECLATN